LKHLISASNSLDLPSRHLDSNRTADGHRISVARIPVTALASCEHQVCWTHPNQRPASTARSPRRSTPTQSPGCRHPSTHTYRLRIVKERRCQPAHRHTILRSDRAPLSCGQRGWFLEQRRKVIIGFSRPECKHFCVVDGACGALHGRDFPLPRKMAATRRKSSACHVLRRAHARLTSRRSGGGFVARQGVRAARRGRGGFAASSAGRGYFHLL